MMLRYSDSFPVARSVRTVVLLLAAFWSASACAQTADRIDRFYLSPTGQPFLLLENARLVTRNRLGATTYSYFDSSLGRPDHVDASNPFQVIVYYRDYGRVVLLDRTLSDLSTLDLFSLDFLQQPGVVARSLDDNLWVFDDWGFRLKKISKSGDQLLSGNDLRLELGIREPPDDILVDDTYVSLLLRESSRLAVFQNTGRFLYWVDLGASDYLAWSAPYLLALRGDTVHFWRAGLRTSLPTRLPYPTAAGDRPLLATGKLLARDSSLTVLQEWNWTPRPTPNVSEN